MNDNGQEAFIGNIRKALGSGGKRAGPDLYCRQTDGKLPILIDGILSRPHSERLGLLEKMTDAAKPVNINVIPVKTPAEAGDGIIKLACEKNPEWGDAKIVVLWNHPLIRETGVEKSLSGLGLGVVFSDHDAGNNGRERFIKESADAFIGVTSADYCVAETATLVLKAASGRERSVSLLPSIHVAVIKLEQIVADFKELYALLDRDLKENPEALDGCMTFITGPSKTADIEATMVHGAHGPRELYIYVLTGA